MSTLVVMFKMSRRKSKGFRPTPRPRSYYSLSEVRQKIADGELLIRSDAVQDALKDFGWGTSEILDVYKMLQPKHFYKTDNSKKKSHLVIDIYKAHINGEDIYTHFYIDDTQNKVIINSFKEE